MIKKINFLKKRWNRRFGKVFNQDTREVKNIILPNNQGLFKVVYSKKLEEWYLSPRGKARYRKPNCFFCEKNDEYHKAKPITTIDHLEILFNIKFVTRNHFLITPIEHRDHMIKDDIVTLQQIAVVSGLIVFGNFLNSGASYPQHVHYQTLEAKFPIVDCDGSIIFQDSEINVEELTYPILAFRFLPTESWKLPSINKIGHICTASFQSFNIIFYNKDIYLIPRIKSVPFNTDGFKFATAEVAGNIFVREKKIYDKFSGEIILTALCDIGLPKDSSLAVNYKNMIIEKLQEVKND